MEVWSHSKLNCILNNPMEYYLSYVQKIRPIQKSVALSIGSAVHWGIEHNTEDLSEFTEENFRARDNYTEEQLLAECMIHGYLNKKDEMFDKILQYNDEKLELLEESHELKLETQLLSDVNGYNKFLGIIDLLLLTNKGFIIIDYKTSSRTPDWDSYTDQLYRYINLINHEFPDIPVLKIGIINLKKTGIRQKKNETENEFRNRLKLEYEIEDSLIEYHEFLSEDIEQNKMKDYINNLSKTIDCAEIMVANEMFYINFTNANGNPYKSQYWDIFYNTPGAEELFMISDHFWDAEDEIFKEERRCKVIDLKTIKHKNILNHYSDYKELRDAHVLDCKDKKCTNESFIEFLKFSGYMIDNDLMKIYEETYKKEDEAK